MTIKMVIISLLGLILPTSVLANEGPSPKGIEAIDHVFVIMMENHGYSQIIKNPNAPYINKLAETQQLATNYFGIGHPSLTNYLELVGGSNFGIQSDDNPDWHNNNCQPNLITGIAHTENPSNAVICPIGGMGKDAATPAIDTTNETHFTTGLNNIDGIKAIPKRSNISGITIVDQLISANKSWKSYQQNLPLQGADRINYSDGVFTNNTDFKKIIPKQKPSLSAKDIVSLYAVKHNPFAYFKNIQAGNNPKLSLKNSVAFDGVNGLYADLATGKVPNFAFIAPNQCNDQHGRSNGGQFCLYDPKNDGTQQGLNPALLKRADNMVQRLVMAIKHSPTWNNTAKKSAIVIVWDENDYSVAPNINHVPAIVITNKDSTNGKVSNRYYNHFSLLKTMESALGLPCLNHACDADVQVMEDLFN